MSSTQNKRSALLSTLYDAHLMLSERETLLDRKLVDLETQRVFALAELNSDTRPEVPSLLAPFEQRRTVRSIADAIKLKDQIQEGLEMLLDDPGSFGVEFVEDVEFE